jgi:hypothetical protein
MKTKLSRSISLAFLMLIVPLLPGNSMPMGKKSNFSGTWILNEQKSDFGEYGRMMASDKIVIVQKGKKLTMERYITTPTGEAYNYPENYTLDGKECINPLWEQSKKTSTVAWSEDKKSLTFTSLLELMFEGNEMKINTVEVYSLEDGGKSMVIKETASTEYGDTVVSFIYDLQQ